MKKLTAGIFATLLAVVSADSAYAAIASQGYVDDKVDTVEATVATKADKSALDTLSGTVTGHTTQIGTINTKIGGYGDIVTHDASEFATSAQGALADTAVQPADITNVERTTNKTTTLSGTSTDAQYPSAKAVWDTIQTETEGIANEADVTDLKGRVGELETASANHVVKNETITGGTHTKITYDAKGLVTAGANLTADDIPTIPNTKVDGLGSLATKSSVATDDIASKAVTKEKLADDIVTSLGKADSALQKTTADGLYAVKSLETQVGTVSKENMGTTTATTVVGGVKEAIDAAKAADGKAVAAQGDVDALEAVVNNETTGLAAAHTAIDAVEGRVTTAEGEIDTIQTKISSMATSDTVTKLTERVTTAEGDISALETAVNDAESGLAATNTIADNALSSAQSAKTTADAALPKATYDNQVGTVSATNMGTSASTVVTAIKEVAGEASAAQSTATAAQKTANAAIPAPTAACADSANKCVLVSSGAGNYSWEVIARGDEE